IQLDGQPLKPLPLRPLTALQSFTSSYLQVLKIPLFEGRFFNENDKRDSAPVALINRSFARAFFPNEDPLGKHIRLGNMATPWQIIGIVGDIRNVSLTSSTQAEVDIPFAQLPWPQMNLLVRSGTDGQTAAAAIRAALSHLDPDQPLT